MYCYNYGSYVSQTPVCVQSSPAPMQGQYARSSATFTVPTSGSYVVSGIDSGASFSLYHDIVLGSDQNLGRFTNGSAIPLTSGTNYYIGNPTNFKGTTKVCFNPHTIFGR